MKEYSKLMCDDSETSSGRETLLDYELSWVLRMAADSACPPRLKRQCHHILFQLIDEDEKDSSIEIVGVKTWKQWEKTDLIADIFLERNGKKELVVLLVEDKAYGKMTEHQRDDYPKLVRKAYDSYEKYADYRGKYQLCQALVTCFLSNDIEFEKLKAFVSNTNWKVYSIGDLPYYKDDSDLTESDLFNEFWLKSW